MSASGFGRTGHTPAERAAAGKAIRAKLPRRRQAELPGADRDAVALLESQAPSRVAELLPVRYGRMLVSPFTFYRGAALVMATDLATTPRSGLNAQICGDAHLSNFGVYASAERRLVFDINDFDETHVGPWEWDVKRLVTSLEIAGRDRGFTPRDRRLALLAASQEYRTAMATFAGMGNLDVWHASMDADAMLAQARSSVSRAMLRRAEATLAKARTRDSMQAQRKLTTIVDGHRRIISDPPLIVPIEEIDPEIGSPEVISEAMVSLLRTYQRTLPVGQQNVLSEYEYVHMAHKVVGVGSVGTRAWIVLFRGRDDDDPLLLQVKQAMPSVIAPFVSGVKRHAQEGQRVVAGQRTMQASSDIFLGWVRVTGLDSVQRDFYVRQLRDWKGSADVDAMIPRGLRVYGQMCAWTLARAHARTGDRIAISSYLGSSTSFDQAIAEFAVGYADQNERDYAAFAEAVETGRLIAQTGV
jgi:uncharacterized protein (DUF2252 family)